MKDAQEFFHIGRDDYTSMKKNGFPLKNYPRKGYINKSKYQIKSGYCF